MSESVLWMTIGAVIACALFGPAVLGHFARRRCWRCKRKRWRWQLHKETDFLGAPVTVRYCPPCYDLRVLDLRVRQAKLKPEVPKVVHYGTTDNQAYLALVNHTRSILGGLVQTVVDADKDKNK